MDFTREPIVETVITPRDGYKLIVRNSHGQGQEDLFVDAIEVVSFGNSYFYRSLEKPKAFFVPVSDYEILEVREARMVLKTPGVERGIKIAGGREAAIKIVKEEAAESEAPAVVEQKGDKRKERRRYHRKRGKSDEESGGEETVKSSEEAREPIEPKRISLIPPPTTLIRRVVKPKEESLPTEEEVLVKETFDPHSHADFLKDDDDLEEGMDLEPAEKDKDEEVPFT